MNKSVKIILVLFLLLTIFVGCASASVAYATVSDTDVYGSSSSVDISTTPISSTSSNIVHIADEYLNISAITPSVQRAVINQNITLTLVDQRGAYVYLNGSTVATGYSFDYGDGGHSVGGDPTVVSYDSFGDKTITLTLTGWDGSNAITKTVSTSVKVSYIDNVTISDTHIGATNTSVVHVNVTSVGTLDYQWYATTTPNDSSSWSSTMFTNGDTDTATFNSNGLSAGTYYVKVNVTAYGVGVEDSYESGFNNSTISVVAPLTLSQPTISSNTTPTSDVSLNGTLVNTVYLSMDAPSVSYGTITYQWYDGDTALSGLTGISNQQVSISDSVSTLHNYTVRVYNWDGNVLLNEMVSNITWYHSFVVPVATFTANKTLVVTNGSSTVVGFNATEAPTGDVYLYNWYYKKNGGTLTEMSQSNLTSNVFDVDFNTSAFGEGRYSIYLHVYGYGGYAESSQITQIDVTGVGTISVSPIVEDTNGQIHLQTTATGYDSGTLRWQASIDSASAVTLDLPSQIEVYYSPDVAGLYQFRVTANYSGNPFYSEYSEAVMIYEVPTVELNKSYVVTNDSIGLIVKTENYYKFNQTSDVKWMISTDNQTYSDISTTYVSGSSASKQALYNYVPTSGGEYYLKSVITYTYNNQTFTQNIFYSDKLYVYELPVVGVTPSTGSSSTSFSLNITNTGYDSVTWMIKNDGGSTAISSKLSPSSANISYVPTSGMAGNYDFYGEVEWDTPSYVGYTNNASIIIYDKPVTPVIQPIETAIASQVQQFTLNLQDGYVTPSGETYRYYWYYQKDNGAWNNFATTTNSNTSTLDLTNLGAGTYNLKVNVSGIGGTSESGIRTAYVVGITNMTVAKNVMDFKDLIALSSAITVGSTSANVHWYYSTTPSDDSSWADDYILDPTSLVTTFGNNDTGIPSGNYTFKVVITGTFGTIDTYEDAGITNVYTQVYRIPTINSVSVTRCVDIATAMNFSTNVVINGDTSISSYKWEYSPRTGTWYDMNKNSVSGTYEWLTQDNLSSTQNDVGNYNVRVTVNTSEGYSVTSDSQTVSVISLSLALNGQSSIAQGSQVSLTASAQNLVASTNYNYVIQMSTDTGEDNWIDVGSQSVLTSTNPSETKQIILTTLGTVYLRIHAWDDSTRDYYTYSYPEISVLSPLKFTLTSNASEGTTAGTLLLTLTHENDGSSLTWTWQISTDNGTSWSNLSTGETSKTVTTSTSNILTLYRVTGSNSAYSNVVSNVVGYLYHDENTTTPITSASGIASSSADKYTIATKTWMPYEIVSVYSLSSVIGLVVTQHALYLVDASNSNTSVPSVISTEYVSYGKISDSKYFNGHLMYKTQDGRIIIQNLVGASGFGNSLEIRGYSGTVTDYDMSDYNYMVAVQGNGVYTYDINGDLQWYVQDTTSDSFAMTKATSDNNFEYAIIASNSSSNILRAYAGESILVTKELPNNINKVYAIASEAQEVLVVTNSNTLICDYTLSVGSSTNTFSWGNYATINNILNYPSAVQTGSLYVGTYSRTLYVYDGNGNKVGEYPTSNILTSTDIAKLSADYAMTGGSNGQVSILQNSGSGWEGTQAVPLQNSIKSLAISDSANTFLACTADYVFCGIQGTTEESGTVLTTTYYLKITVVDAYGNTLSNNGVKVVSSSGTNLYTTDSFGSVTIEVVPTKSYTISLPNGEDSITYIADNYALQYVTLRYPSSANTDKLTYGATLRDNRYIDMSFVNNNSNTYKVTFTVYNTNKTILYQESSSSTINFSATFDTNTQSTKDFIVNITADPTGDYTNHVYRTYTIHVQTEVTGANSTGTSSIVVGTIPLLPVEMDEKWRILIFGGLIMIIGALFSYQHSRTGSVLVAIIAGVMTYLQILPLNPIWVGCMIFLAILTVYSFAAQNEG